MKEYNSRFALLFQACGLEWKMELSMFTLLFSPAFFFYFLKVNMHFKC